MKVIFMGTPDFAVNTLEKIIEAGHEVMLVVTQPDKPKGRGNTMQFPPVKECAVSHGLEVFQPVKIREDASVEYLKKFAPDIIILDSRQRTFSPPERTFTFFTPSSPANSILPRNPRT